MRDPDYSPELAGRLSKLETAISKQRTVKFEYWSIARGVQRERTIDPYALLPHEGSWYVLGRDHESDAIRTFKVLRIRRDIKFATRRERDFRLPKEFDASKHRPPPPWQMGEIVGEARIELSGDTAWWVERTYREPTGVSRTACSSRPTPISRTSRAWILRLDGRAVPLEPDALRREVATGLRRVADAAHGAAAVPAKAKPARAEELPERPAGPVSPERFGILQALLAYLLAACGEESSAVIPARDLVERFPDPGGGGRGAPVAPQPRQLRRRLLRRLRRAARRRDPRRQGALRRHVPLAAAPDAARGARDPARARVRRADDRRRGAPPLDRVRKKLEETFGEFDLQPTASARPDKDEETLIRDAERRDQDARARRDRVLEGRRGPGGRASRRAARARARAALLVRPHLGPHPRRASGASASTGCAPRRADRRDVRSARGLRARAPARRPRGADRVLAGGRALGGRAGRRRRSSTARR